MTNGSPDRRRPTLSAVAAIAGTSVPTVSKVLRGGTDVSPQMRLKVMDAVRTVGYTRRGRSAGERFRDESDAPSTIEVVVNHVEGTWMNRVLAGIEYEAAAAGLDVVITLARENHDWTSRLLRRRSAGAVVVLVDPSSSQFKALSAAGIPVVLIDPMSRPPDGTVSVGVANWDGGRIAAEHLLSLGHTRIGIVAGDRRHLYSRARIDGFRAAAEAAAEAPAPSEAVISVAHGNWDPEKAEAVTHWLFDRDPAITAVFACSDTMALGVYDALAARGLRVPTDVSVVGFDDRPEAQWARPPLTTVRQPTAELGATAVKRLLEIARTDRNELKPRSRLELSTDLVIRASTSRPGHTTVRSEDLRAQDGRWFFDPDMGRHSYAMALTCNAATPPCPPAGRHATTPSGDTYRGHSTGTDPSSTAIRRPRPASANRQTSSELIQRKISRNASRVVDRE